MINNKMCVMGISCGQKSGVAYFRIMMPFNYINNNIDDIESIFISDDNINIESELLNDVDVVHFHANCSKNELLMNKLFEMQSKGCKLIMDLDDFFEIPETNPSYEYYTNNLTKPIKKNLLKVNYITTTTKEFKNELKKWTLKPIFIFPNVIDTSLEQYTNYENEFKKIRIGFIGGSSHQKDIEILKGTIERLGDYNDKIQWIIGGFDVNDIPELSNWNVFEQILTNDYTTLNSDYKDYLLRYDRNDYPDVDNMPYRRLWCKNIHNYATLFNNIDVLVAPLVNNKFNRMKSELKVIEAGNFGKLFIGSDLSTYNNVIENNKNGILISPFNNEKGWSNAIKKIIDDKEYYNMLKTNLKKTIQDKYNIKKWTEKRINFYKDII